MTRNLPIIKLIEAMNEQPIAFNKHYVFIGCGINGALMLSQLVYWTSRTKNSDGWIYKTHHDWTLETGMTRREQETARKTLKSLGFLSEKKEGVPRRVYFKVERENLYKALIEYSESIDINSMHNSAILNAQNVHTECTETPDCMHNSAILNAQISPSNTENTYREYTENTSDIICAENAPQKTKFKAKEFLLNNGVSEQTASEYIDLRNKKKKPITQRALELVFKQAQEAKLSNERVFQIIVVRGWESFKASWNWQETASELTALEQPQAKQVIHAEQQPQPQFKGVAKKFKGVNA
ncbi:DNA-binding protein [Acinetobacter ursingii]|nr:DNA-binding protein [Acinetobacter ursingii]MCU4521964.1 DNA-binding protein [Acinetobacter ursingii]